MRAHSHTLTLIPTGYTCGSNLLWVPNLVLMTKPVPVDMGTDPSWGRIRVSTGTPMQLPTLVDHENAHSLVSAPVQAVEDNMKALGVSISASRMPVPCSQSHNGSNCCTSHHPTKCCKTASIFLDIFAKEGDTDEDEDEDTDEVVVAHSNLATQVLPAGHAHYDQDVQCIVACYEERPPPKTQSLLVPLEPHHLVLPEAQESRLYIVDFLSSMCPHFY
jgi:hypothetical protein